MPIVNDYILGNDIEEYTIDELVGEADKRMYKNKAYFHALADTTSQKK